MDGWVTTAYDLLTSDQAQQYIRAAVILLIGLVLARFLYKRLDILRLHPQHRLLLRRSTTYLILAITVASVLRQLGVNLGVLLGAAGLLTVAVGFAAQTSMSNLISGLFLMGERPFVIGDIIKIDDTVGIVVSVDLLSVKLRTFDNLLVRIPNESMLKSNVTNMTHFPIRRYDMKIGVAYKEDVEKVRLVLFAVADRNPICLEEPPPLLIFLGFADSALEFQFSVWGATTNYLELRNTMQEQVKKAFDDHGIEIPFPHRTLYTGSKTEPFPIRVVKKDQG